MDGWGGGGDGWRGGGLVVAMEGMALAVRLVAVFAPWGRGGGRVTGMKIDESFTFFEFMFSVRAR